MILLDRFQTRKKRVGHRGKGLSLEEKRTIGF